MHDVLYLHGFGETHPQRCRVACALRTALPTVNLHTPSYHPGGRVEATEIGRALADCIAIIERSSSGIVHIVGYSFGGLLAAILASRRPDIVFSALLLAPAIDNYARNYEGRDPREWRMPYRYVEELQSYPARPNIVRPTTLVHGMLDVDALGSAPWRVQQWVREQSFRSVSFLDGVDHSLEPWLSASALTNERCGHPPTFQQLATDLVRGSTY